MQVFARDACRVELDPTDCRGLKLLVKTDSGDPDRSERTALLQLVLDIEEALSPFECDVRVTMIGNTVEIYCLKDRLGLHSDGNGYWRHGELPIRWKKRERAWFVKFVQDNLRRPLFCLRHWVNRNDGDREKQVYNQVYDTWPDALQAMFKAADLCERTQRKVAGKHGFWFQWEWARKNNFDIWCIEERHKGAGRPDSQTAPSEKEEEKWLSQARRLFPDEFKD
jgi:hypothetical protein